MKSVVGRPGCPGDSRLVMVCWLAWIVVGILPALFNDRFFYADGAYFFLQILESRSVLFPAEGRAAIYLLTQWPAPLAIAAGCTDIRLLAWCFGAGLMLMLAFLHGAALWLLLRRGLKLQAFVYVVTLWLMMGYSGLCIVTDSHTPTAIFLLAVVLAVSFIPERMGSWLALVAIGGLSFSLYEFWAFYSAALLVLLAWRVVPHWPGMSVRVRLACLGTMVVFTASSGVHAWRLLHASDNPNQASLLQMLHGTTYPVYLALITWGYPWIQSAQSFLAQAIRPDGVKGIAHDPSAGWDPYGPGHEGLLRSIAGHYGIKWE